MRASAESARSTPRCSSSTREASSGIGRRIGGACQVCRHEHLARAAAQRRPPCSDRSPAHRAHQGRRRRQPRGATMRETLTFKRFAWSNAVSAPSPASLAASAARCRARNAAICSARHASERFVMRRPAASSSAAARASSCKASRSIAANIGLVAAKTGAQVGPPRRAIGAHIGVKLERRLLRHPGKRRQRPIGQVGAIPALHIGRGDIPRILRYARHRTPALRQGNGEAEQDGPAESGVREAAPPAQGSHMALANKRRRHAPEQHRRILGRNHHDSGLRPGQTPISIAVGAAGSVLAAGSTVITRQPDRPQQPAPPLGPQPRQGHRARYPPAGPARHTAPRGTRSDPARLRAREQDPGFPKRRETSTPIHGQAEKKTPPGQG